MLDPKPQLDNNHAHKFHPNGNWGTMNSLTKVQKIAQKYENLRNWDSGGVQFRAEQMEDESGVCSPPLWKTSPPKNPVHTRCPQNNFGNLSPNSRSQAIARGQRELMEMVKNMPESCYELSLKDLVDHQPINLESQEECLVEENNFGGNPMGKEIKRQESKKNENKAKVMMRGRGIENKGLLLNMVFPGFLRSRKKKKSATNPFSKPSYELSLNLDAQEEYCLVEEKGFEIENQRVKEIQRQESKKNEKKAKMMRGKSIENGGLFLKMVFPKILWSRKTKKSATNAFSRVSPKPEAMDKSSKGVDMEWWKKRFSGSSGSESDGRSSSRSGSSGSSRSRGSSSSSSSRSNSRRRSGCSLGCRSFFLFRNNK